MGCFSYHCKECGEAIRDGEGVKLYLLHEGKVLEEMEGNYNLYGNVDDIEWENDWGEIIDLHFDNFRNNGIAAIHTDCFANEIPEHISEDDEQQGSGKARHRPSKKTSHKFHSGFSKSDRDLEGERKVKGLSDRLSTTVKEAEEILAELKINKNK